ncbi:hypothetical protein [Parasitella parasitica]|uniref:BTB domain-containing protein n=1 Tax=Parasitella parasitica TaxID=35722 RepID=A0A0B7NQN9_9FUNG|nr:hypothetical protein [Parasitella parasitica]
MAKEQPLRQDVSLTSIYQALQKPNSSSSARFLAQLKKSSTKEIDYTLRKLLSYAKHNNEQWPRRRLVRCLDYIYTHTIKSRLEERVQLPSFKSNIRWIVDMLANIELTEDEDSQQVQSAVKFICGLLQDIAAQSLSDSTAAAPILAEIRHRQGVKSLLSMTHGCSLSIRIYSIRALTSQLQHFAKDMIGLNAFDTLSLSLFSISNLLNVLSLEPPVTDAVQQRNEFDQCVMACRLLELLFKYEAPSQPSAARQKFAGSEHFLQLLSVWQAACYHDYSSLANDASSAPRIKSQRLLVYSLTTIVQKCISLSKAATGHTAEEKSRAKWQPLLALCMQRWIRGTCCTMNKAVFTAAMLDQDKSIMKKLVQISLDILPALKQYNHWLEYVDQAVCDLTNFIMAYVSQPILPEQASLVGTQSTLLHTDLCIDVEERGYQADGEMLNQHQDLFVLLLESLIQHVQLATPLFIKTVSGRVAWCLKSILTILLNAGQLETSGLCSRIQKLVVFFLHYDDAIHSFAASSTNISSLVWGPTIAIAKQGLLTAVSLTRAHDVTAEQSVSIYKAKRAFVSLETISKHPRACERLVDCQVLQLVDVSLVPSGEVIEKTASLLSVYALFGRFIAALSRRTAFVRTRLRDECNLIPMVMKLLQEAVQLKEAKRNVAAKSSENDILKGWNHVIASCLMVVSTFQYDEPSMRMWLSWDKNARKDEKDEQTPADMAEHAAATRQSILPVLLSVLFPWRNHTDRVVSFGEMNAFLKSDHQVILLASQLLDQLSVIPICGRQMITDQTALNNLCSLMVCLTAAYCPDQPQCMFRLAMSGSMYMDIDSTATTTTTTTTTTIETILPMDQDNTAEKSWTLKDTVLPANAGLDAEDGQRHEEEPSNVGCAGHLRRCAVRTLVAHDNIQFTMLSDAFTSFFQPMLQHPARGTSHEYWRRLICDDLFDKKMHDFASLFKFTETADDAIKLHEMSAVAVGYAAMGSRSELEWNQSLGLTVLDGSIVSSRQAFGVFCQMLVYELEYGEEQQDTQQRVLSVITPFRRYAAAQVLETLALESEVVWKVEAESIRENLVLPTHMPLDEPLQVVSFVTDDAPMPGKFISGNRQLLRARSPIFDALLSEDYAEHKLAAIPLHDVTFHSLQLFIDVIHQLNEKADMSRGDSSLVDRVLAPSTSWRDIVDLLLISDRFGSTVVKSLCEHWILEKVKHVTDDGEGRSACLEGMVGLFRQCCDPMEKDGGIVSDTWPFATVLREVLKTLLQFMTETCQTRSFNQMVTDRRVEELDVFCNGLAYLLQKK